MSGICGVLRADGSPVDPGLLLRMREVASHRGPDGSGIWTGGHVGLAHRLLWNSEESVHESQPMTNGRGLWITGDCRIDNRDKLEDTFRSRGLGTERASPDCFYILLAYEVWGEEAPDHLLGDFSFALWDERSRALFCARDPIGIKPFVYHWDGKRFLFGSEMKQIFQDPTVSSDLNVPHLADLLTMCFPNREETPYQAIRRLPPGHSICIQDGRFQLRRYWNWDPDSEQCSTASLRENAEAFRAVFHEAVRARLRIQRGSRIGSLLSGGLDSSSIVSVAASLRNSAGDGSPFPVFSLRFPEANRAYQLRNTDFTDESPYIQAVVERHRLEPHPVEIKGWGPLENLREVLWHQETPPFFPNLAYFTHLFRVAGNAGVRALLHGEGGDEVFHAGDGCLARDLRRGKVFGFIRESLARQRGWGRSRRSLCWSLVRSFAPEWIKAPYRRFVRQPVPDWIDPRFARRIDLRQRALKDFAWNPLLHDSSSYGILNWIHSGAIPPYVEAVERAAASVPIEIRYPFLDPRVLRFLAAVPWDQKEGGAVRKRLLREAIGDLLPDPVRDRPRKAEFTPVVRASYENYLLGAMRETFESPHPVLRPMIVPGKVGRFFNEYFFAPHPRRSHRDGDSTWFLWYLLSIDQWLKHRTSFFKNRREEVAHENQEGLSRDAVAAR